MSHKHDTVPSTKKAEASEHIAVFKSLFSGACAGAVAKTVIAPLDRTKIKFQVSKTPFSYNKAFYILYKGYMNNGILSWWRGNSATMARVIPYAAIQFTAHEQLKRKLGSVNHEALPPGKRFIAGSLAGAAAVCFTYPFDMVRARMAVAGKLQYSTLRQTFKTIYQQEGAKTFFNGFVPTLVGITPYAGTSFFMYESLKNRYRLKYPGVELTTLTRLGFGAIAGVCGQGFSYPLDIVRRRMQIDGLDGKGYKYRNLLWTIKYIFRTEGIVKGFYKGMSINGIKGPIAVGVSFTTFDTIQHFLDLVFHETEVHTW